MTDRPAWAGELVDLETPSIARIWDYWLGGSHNLLCDREAAAAMLPTMPYTARVTRAFLVRAVRTFLRAGIDQFLDLGSGIPTVGNVHEVARYHNPDARVVYVDRDPVAAEHTRAILAGVPNVGVAEADVRDSEAITDSAPVRELLDLSRPVGLLMVAVLHFIPDADDPAGLVARYRDLAAGGSMIAIVHGSNDIDATRTPQIDSSRRAYDRTVAPVTLRPKSQIESLFAGYEVLDPGIVATSRWRPEPNDPSEKEAPSVAYAGVGIKRG